MHPRDTKIHALCPSQYDHDVVAKRAAYPTTETSKVSPTIASEPYVNEEIVGKFVEAWRKSGFLQ
jgi:hypothetical protein